MGADAVTVTVLIENTYECGRESDARVEVPAPAPGQDLETWWIEEVHQHMGDGHPCGSSEHAMYEATVIAAEGRPELVGLTWGGEG